MTETPLRIYRGPRDVDATHDANGRRLHVCDVCGRTDVWGPHWTCYGPLCEDRPERLLILCSQACRNQGDPDQALAAKLGCAVGQLKRDIKASFREVQRETRGAR